MEFDNIYEDSTFKVDFNLKKDVISIEYKPMSDLIIFNVEHIYDVIERYKSRQTIPHGEYVNGVKYHNNICIRNIELSLGHIFDKIFEYLDKQHKKDILKEDLINKSIPYIKYLCKRNKIKIWFIIR